MIPYPRMTRDPDGLVFTVRGHTLIQINRSYGALYDQLIDGGLYAALRGKLGRFKESGLKYARTDAAYRVIQPHPVPFASYPYEWGFSQWKAAALLVLDIQEAALAHELSLKRATPYSVQFIDGAPQWIDPLAFEPAQDGRRWAAYPQFVAELLAPLALMAQLEPSMGRLMLAYPQGIAPHIAAAMLPMRARVNHGLNAHIHSAGKAFSMGRASRAAQLELLADLRETVQALRWTPSAVSAPPLSNYDTEIQQQRQALVRGFLAELTPHHVWDMFAGAGVFSLIAAERSALTVAFSPFPEQVEALYHKTHTTQPNLLPLLMDWQHASPALGWGGREQRALTARALPDVLLLMEGVPRLALSYGIPLEQIAAQLARLAPVLIVEFIPTEDPHCIALMAQGNPAPTHYTPEAFDTAFRVHYQMLKVEGIRHSERLLYLLRRRED